MNFTIPHNIFISTIFFVSICLSNFNGVAQKYEIFYAQLHQNILDTSIYKIPPFAPKFDTLAKWILTYADGKSIMRQTEDSPTEQKSYFINKQTGNFDSHTTHNMGINDIIYNDNTKNLTRRVSYFFDSKYVIEDTSPNYKWVFLADKKMIGTYLCKHAYTKDPITNGIVYDVWYTEEIPISSGPAGLHGLPGLILEASRNMKPYYKVMNVKKLDDNIEIVIKKPVPEEKSISLLEFDKIKLGVPFVNKNTPPPHKKN